MKILTLSLLFIVFVGIAATSHCVTFWTFIIGTYCYEFELKPDQPFNVSEDNNHVIFEFRKVTGSIGSKTLSTLSFVRFLTISDSTISGIEDGALCSIPNIRTVSLHNSGIPPILTEGHLKNCNNLTDLSVPGIKIELTALPHLTNLYSIDLTRQKISQFTAGYLAPLQELRMLKISHSEVEQIEPSAFCLAPELRTLILNNNKLPTLTKSLFENCQSVKKLYLLSNGNAAVEENAFSGFSNAISAVLNSLSITQLTKGYLNGLSGVESLEVTNSGISGISSDAFVGFSNLNYLSLRGNKIREFDSSILSFMPNLKELDMSKNELTGIETFKHPSLVLLLLNSNNITSIDSDIVKLNLPKLRHLGINDDQISAEE